MRHPGADSVAVHDAQLDDALRSLSAVGLDDVLARADLQRRVDRKYLVPVQSVTTLVAALASTHRVLEVGDRRTTTYRSTYLDSADLRCCRDHLQGRRLRWKTRQRLYVEDRLCRLEVKVRTGRGDTLKHTLTLAAEQYGVVDDDTRALVRQLLGDSGREGADAGLRPTLEVGYTRATLVDLDQGTRVTLDRGMVATPLHGDGEAMRVGTVVLDPRFVIVETKGHARAAHVDRLLLAAGCRPTSLSKYATSAALLAPGIPDNPVRHHHGRHLHLTSEDLPC